MTLIRCVCVLREKREREKEKKARERAGQKREGYQII